MTENIREWRSLLIFYPLLAVTTAEVFDVRRRRLLFDRMNQKINKKSIDESSLLVGNSIAWVSQEANLVLLMVAPKE